MLVPYSPNKHVFLKAVKEGRVRKVINGKVQCPIKGLIPLEECRKCENYVGFWRKPSLETDYVECKVKTR